MIAVQKNKTPLSSTGLEKEFQWFAWMLDARFNTYFNASEENTQFIAPPDLEHNDSNYAKLVKKHGFGIQERLILCLALSPHLQSHVLDLFFTKNQQLDRPFTEFGGYTGKDHRGFLPTGETAAFLLTPEFAKDRVDVWEIFGPRHPFALENIIHLNRTDEKEPFLSGRLLMSDEVLYTLTTGKTYLPESTALFPAKRINTTMEWEDLIVSPFIMDELMQLRTWIDNQEQLMQDPVFSKHVKPGFRSLFYGPPGTGKTMAASLIGKVCEMSVYRIDLSLIVSKYIGETEKNLAKVFKYAEKQNWILFFDEADALFGKRTQTNSSNDRFANQEVAYLLQRIENFPGIIILASNLKSNMDEAFSRRFQSTVYFPIPEASQRLRLWQNIFSGAIQPEPAVNFNDIAEKYELSGGSMINVLRNSTLQTIKKGRKEISKQDIIQGIRKEFQKQGKTI